MILGDISLQRTQPFVFSNNQIMAGKKTRGEILLFFSRTLYSRAIDSR